MLSPITAPSKSVSLEMVSGTLSPRVNLNILHLFALRRGGTANISCQLSAFESQKSRLRGAGALNDKHS